MSLSLFIANTTVIHNQTIYLPDVQIKYFDNIEVVDGLYDDYQACRDFNTQPVFYPNVVQLRKINLVPQGSGYAKVQFVGTRDIQAINRGLIKISADTPAYTSGLNKDVVVDCVKDGINFMSDWVTSQAFRNAALSAGRKAGTVAMVASRVPGAMPIALGAFALNLALNFVKEPVTIPSSSGGISVTNDIVWVNASATAPNETTDIVLPLRQGGGNSLQNPAKSAEYIASQALLKETMALQIRQKSLDYVSDIFHEYGEPWNVDQGLDPITKLELSTQLQNKIADSARNKRDRVNYGLDKGLDGINISLDKLSKLDYLSNLSELLCICEGGQSIFRVLNDIKDLFSSGEMDKEALIEVLDKYFIPDSNTQNQSWVLQQIVTQSLPYLINNYE